MLSIKEICQKTGISLHTFQSWRRNDSILLPRPVAVKKRVIYFDDSIVERIKFIRAQLAGGKSLAQIEGMLAEELAKDYANLPSWEIMQAEHDEYAAEVDELVRKWEKGDCKQEVCAALHLDPLLSGEPRIFAMHAPEKQWGTILAYVTIISADLVYMAEVCTDIFGKAEVLEFQTVGIAEHRMMQFILGKEYASDRQLLEVKMLPYLFFRGMDDVNTRNECNKKLLIMADSYNKIFTAGSEFIEKLKNDI